jgi:secondary thiamine-phosphate synthase enzyme
MIHSKDDQKERVKLPYRYSLKTDKENLHDITSSIREAVRKSGVEDGFCLVYCPHTTAGITINENADPDVIHDILLGLSSAFPSRKEFRHMEGNSAAHLKASCVGASVTILIEKGELILGTWQGVYFCEFDGPRRRNYYVQVALVGGSS